MTDIQNACLSKIVLDGDLRPFIDARIHAAFFTDDRSRKVFEIIMDHYGKFNKVPSADVVHKAYPRYKFSTYEEPTEYYLTQLQETRKKFILVSGMHQVGDLLNDDDEGLTPGTDIERVMRNALDAAHHEIPQGILGDYYELIDEHLARFDFRAQNPGVLRGISTGIPGIDLVTSGLQKQQLITLVGTPKSGKSSTALSIAYHGTTQAYKALYFTFEMTTEEQYDRLSSLISKVDLNKILRGTFSDPERKKIETELKRHSALAGKLIFAQDTHGATTLSGVQSRIADEKPDIVIIDGVYLMDDESNPPEPKGSPRALTALTRGFKRMAQRMDLPIVVTTQALDARSKGGLRLDSIGYSSSFAQDSDVIFGTMPHDRVPHVSKFSVLGSRSGPKVDCWLRFDWNTGTIAEIKAAEVEKLANVKPAQPTAAQYADDDEDEPLGSSNGDKSRRVKRPKNRGAA